MAISCVGFDASSQKKLILPTENREVIVSIPTTFNLKQHLMYQEEIMPQVLKGKPIEIDTLYVDGLYHGARIKD